MSAHNIGISLDPSGRGSVMIDDHDISGCVTGLTITSKAQHQTVVRLDLRIYETDVDGWADVIVPDATRDLLVKLGWTPPEVAE